MVSVALGTGKSQNKCGELEAWEEKEILKINMTCLYLRVNYCMSIVLEMKPGPKIRQT